MVSLSDIEDLDDNTMRLFRSYVRIANLSKDYMLESATSVDIIKGRLQSIENKLDKLIERA